ncbi:putative membrane-associated kinase regulator 4 [Heracleum sosnowskyi]|uniref:Membrane-associated kinase regulator 4 n=1 Tax=Heracleum sosnowskyi TaxID=360622 RepID=A0AAD8N119_9APIA|nr:putative membrane-associated kinase regulator 4 [Heracleum sosnowskyi]
MAPNHKHVEEDEDEGYIDMDLSSFSSNLFGHSVNHTSPPKDKEFEFFSNDQESEATIFPADELFYKGKLLPLHLPPRLQMLQNLLQQSPTTTTSLPQSCNVSPSESFRSTSDKQLNDHFFAELTDDKFIVVGDIPKKSWPKKKLKMIKKLLVGQNLMAYSAHLKSLFSKSSCSDDSFAKVAANKADATGNISKCKSDHLSKKAKTSNRRSGWPIRQEDPLNISHRRSFHGDIRHPSTSKRSYSPSLSSSCSSCSSSSSFSFDTNGVCGLDLRNRRSSSGSDTEGSIDAAIAHCKK